MGDAASWAGVVLAAGSLVVAVVALLKSSRAQHNANAAQQRIVEIEERREQDRQSETNRATLRPQIRNTAPHTYRLYLVNQGAAEARNIRVEMDDVPFASHRAAFANDLMPTLVGPHSEISCILRLSLDCTPPFKVRITWDDDSGNRRTYNTTLTF